MNPTHESHAVVYTDGACGKNPGPGGWAAVYHVQGGRWEASGGYARSTSSRMEILAAIHALEGLSIADNGIGPITEVDVVTDSQYVANAVNEWLSLWSRNGWVRADGKSVKNVDLWQLLIGAMLMHSRVSFHWVKGHNGNPENERADQLASEASKVDGWPADPGYRP